MNDQEFYTAADEIAASSKPENDAVDGKDRALADLLCRAYEDDLKIMVAGPEKPAPSGLSALLSISVSVPIPNARLIVAYTSHRTAKMEPDKLHKQELDVRTLFRLLYNNMEYVGVIFNFQVPGREVVLSRSDLMSWIPETIHRDLEAEYMNIGNRPKGSRKRKART